MFTKINYQSVFLLALYAFWFQLMAEEDQGGILHKKQLQNNTYYGLNSQKGLTLTLSLVFKILM